MLTSLAAARRTVSSFYWSSSVVFKGGLQQLIPAFVTAKRMPISFSVQTPAEKKKTGMELFKMDLQDVSPSV